MLCLFTNSDISSIVSIWNAACGSDLAITPRFVEYNTRPATGVIQFGQIATQNDRAVGFVFASTLPNNTAVASPQLGWIDALAVMPDAQKQGVGGELLGVAEDWLRAQGCNKFRLGGSLKPFIPGLPIALGDEKFFRARGYGGDNHDADFASDLQNYMRRTHPERSQAQSKDASRIVVRPAQPGDESAMMQFFDREFPNRWHYEFQEFLREQGRVFDYQILITDRGVDGFARLTFADSERPIERFYIHRLPRPWGQLGPIGVSKDTRGKGYGGALLDGALWRLHEQGIRGCVIDWTSLADFYGKFGFKPHREYAMLVKDERFA